MKLSTRDIVLVGAFAALAALGAVIVRFGGDAIVPFSPIPFVAVASGLMLGSRRGALAMLVYVLVGLIGVPVFAKAPFGGPQYVLQPSFGFLLGFIAAAFVSGLVMERWRKRRIVHYGIASLVGLVVIYLLGLPYLWVILNFVMGADVLAKLGMSKPIPVMTVLKIGFIPFIIFDLGKMVVAAAVAREVGERVAGAVPQAGEV